MDTNINKNKEKPLVSVIMAAYNADKYIAEAIESILSQTYQNWELIIADDASSDKTVEIINEYTKRDSRIKLICQDKNSGPAAARNEAIKKSLGKYIAILDSDDISLPARLEEQVKFLEGHPDFGIIGSWTSVIDETGTETGFAWENTLPAEKIPSMLLFKNYFTNSATMIRKSAIPVGGYRAEFIPSEDYDLWVRIIKKWSGYNLQKILTKYRVHQDGISQKKQLMLKKAVDQIFKIQLMDLNIIPSDEEMDLHKMRSNRENPSVEDYIDKKHTWIQKIRTENIRKSKYKEPYFSEVLSDKWFETCNMSTNLGLIVWNNFWKSNLSKLAKLSLKQKIKFFIKCLIKK